MQRIDGGFSLLRWLWEEGDLPLLSKREAASLASGVQYARFTVTDELGRVRYGKVNKLLMMK